jgi:hypothetical protein
LSKISAQLQLQDIKEDTSTVKNEISTLKADSLSLNNNFKELKLNVESSFKTNAENMVKILTDNNHNIVTLMSDILKLNLDAEQSSNIKSIINTKAKELEILQSDKEANLSRAIANNFTLRSAGPVLNQNNSIISNSSNFFTSLNNAAQAPSNQAPTAQIITLNQPPNQTFAFNPVAAINLAQNMPTSTLVQSSTTLQNTVFNGQKADPLTESPPSTFLLSNTSHNTSIQMETSSNSQPLMSNALGKSPVKTI